MQLQSRLRAIEKEHKSIGDILDHRTLPILAPVHYTKRNTKDTYTREIYEEEEIEGSPPPSTTIEEAVESSTLPHDKKVNKTKKKRINPFVNEEAIWRVKSSEPNYSLRRSPALQDFYMYLNSKKKTEFIERCKDKLAKMSLKFRQETRESQAIMDATNLFSSEVNAHRAQNLYLNKLYNGISSESLEDKVLVDMMATGREIEVCVYYYSLDYMQNIMVN
jgi:hypothetical protein